MNWKISYLKRAVKFLSKQPNTKQSVQDEVVKLIKSFNNEVVSIDFRALKGEWEGYHRIRKGKIRILVKMDFDNNLVNVYDIDFRGNIYTK